MAKKPGFDRSFDINTTSNAPDRRSFMAWSVLMVHSNAVAVNALAPLEVLSVGGPDIMVTGLLNGCTFCM